MRWLVAQPGPGWSVHDVYVGWVEALRAAGEDVHTFNLDDRLSFYSQALLPVEGEQRTDGAQRIRKALGADQAIELAVNGLAASLWKIRPDVLLLVSAFMVPVELLAHARRHGTRVVVLHTEEPYEVDRELAVAEHADLNLINDPTHIDAFRALGPTVYSPHAYRPTVHRPGPARDDLVSDLAFVGTGFPSRRWFFEQLVGTGALAGREVLLAGNWHGVGDDSPLRPFLASDDPDQCCDNAEAAEIYRSARVGINLYRREHNDAADAAGAAIGPREVEMAACGMFFLRDPRVEGDSLFPMLPRFAGPAEAAELLRWWLAHPDQRAEAAAGARAAIVDRTFDNHARKLLALFERQPVTP